MQDQSTVCEKKFLEKAQEKLGDTSSIPTFEITKFCRMVSMYCEAEGKVSKSFTEAMAACIKKIEAVEGLEEILEELNQCPK